MGKLNLNRVAMPRLDPKIRVRNFNEQAREEANRCLQCHKHLCIEGCPVGGDIPDFVKAIGNGDLPEAVRILKSKNSLPGICGRVGFALRRLSASLHARWLKRVLLWLSAGWSGLLPTGNGIIYRQQAHHHLSLIPVVNEWLW